MILSIDRFEGDCAVCIADSGEVFNLNVSCLPANVHEGSLICSTENGYELCPCEEAARREKNFKRADCLFDK